MSQTIAIVGSKECSNPSAVRAFVAALEPGTVVLTGGAKGVEEIVADEAKKHGLTVKAVQPEWPAPGSPQDAMKAALTARDERLVATADKVVVFDEGRLPLRIGGLAEKAGKLAPAVSPADEMFGAAPPAAEKAAEQPAGKPEWVLVRGPKDEQANAQLKELGAHWDGMNKGYRLQRSAGLEAFLAEHPDFSAEKAPRRVRVVGDTFEIKDQLKALGGKDHKETYQGAERWVTELPADKLEEVKALLAGRKGVTLLGEGPAKPDRPTQERPKQDRILVTGKTFEVRDQLKALGGELSTREGASGKRLYSYRLPADKLSEVQALAEKHEGLKVFPPRGMEQFAPTAQGLER